jgi:Membrane-bound metallopeptidase
MAVTKIWDVKGWLGKVVIYIENPAKTENPAFYEKEDMTETQVQGLVDVIEYAVNAEKTEKQYYVSALNCSTLTARNEMIAVKKRFGKEKGIVAFHGYQSFAEGEVTPDMAHEIGVRLAEELWGERFQVLIATHLDKANHIHNHFVLNSVSFLDGKRYNDCTATYMEMRKASDRLCKEYNLSVIENPKRGKGKQYGEYRAEKEGRYTYRSLVKADVDRLIAQAATDKQFFYLLKQEGYEVKRGKDITVRQRDKPRGLKLERNFGAEYSYERICQRILESRRTLPLAKGGHRKHYQIKVQKGKAKKIGGLRGLYLRYCFELGIFPKRKHSPARTHFLLREDLAKLEQITKEIRLLGTYRIDTESGLFLFREKRQQEIGQLSEKRSSLKRALRTKAGKERGEELRGEIAGLSKEIGRLRKEVVLCDRIAERSGIMREKLQAVQKERQQGKEGTDHEHRRRSGRANSADEPQWG